MKNEKANNPSPYLSANFFSRLTFWWLLEIFRLGNSKNLRPDNLYSALPDCASEKLGDELERSWENEMMEASKRKRKPNLWRAIRNTFKGSLVKHGIGLLFANICDIAQPLMLAKMLLYYDNSVSGMSVTEAWIHAASLIAVIICQLLVNRHVRLDQYSTGMRVKIACSSLLYRKILKLSSSSSASGKVVNIMSNDLKYTESYIIAMHFLWLMPLMSMLIMYLIWQQLGIAALAGILLILIQVVPTQVINYKLIRTLRAKLFALTDKRVLLIKEIINGIKVIKMYAWEAYFEKIVQLARKHEIDMLLKLNYVRGGNYAMAMFTDRIALFGAVFVYAMLGNVVSADKIFSTIQYFVLIRQTVGVCFTWAVYVSSSSSVALQRMQNLLLEDEIASTAESSLEAAADTGAISIKSLDVQWDKKLILQNLKLRIAAKKLHVVVGPTAAGKSSLLKLILGELPAKSGEISVRGKVSYTSQEAWLFNDSLRNNVLFGQEYDQQRYDQVIDACQLTRDLAQLPYGDKTLVGERGMSLSGGQCARVNLARSVYRKADIYLFDSPLSAVDTLVAKRIYRGCIKGFLKDKTRILVTHQLQYLMEADDIVTLKNGQIQFQGDYAAFSTNPEYMDYLLTNNEQENRLGAWYSSQDSRDCDFPSENPSNCKAKLQTAAPSSEALEQAYAEEALANGSIKAELIVKYLTADGSSWKLLSVVAVCLLTQLAMSTFDYCLSLWTKQKEKSQEPHFAGGGGGGGTGSSVLYASGALTIAIVLLANLKNLLFFRRTALATRAIHNQMFRRLLRAPMQFFYDNPAGRVLNRFSKDSGTVDTDVAENMLLVVDGTLMTIAVIIQVIIINWWTMGPVLLVGYAFLKINAVYVSTAQALQRIEASAKSPLLSLVNSTFMGLATIRACGAQAQVRREFDARQDAHTAAYHLSVVISAVYSMWLQLLLTCITIFVICSFILLKNESTMAGDVGLALTQLMSVCGLVFHVAMRQYALLMTQMTSVERMFQYSELHSEEALEEARDKSPPPDPRPSLDPSWPNKAEVTFKGLTLRYREEIAQPVLKDIDICIKSTAKIGVVGRTGAGKSSLIAALFRLAHFDGALIIDNVDIKRISLSDLRSKISIIPQEATVFKGSLRDNLDPLQQHDDASLWSALRDVQLHEHFRDLQEPVDENLSTGQCQLLCLARAIVRKNKILVLDEATANIDVATDEIIQKTIRQSFRDCIVLTIAHRLSTIMDSDKIIVMDAGRVREFDHPHILLQKTRGYFRKIVEQSANASVLKQISEKAYTEGLNDKNLKMSNS